MKVSSITEEQFLKDDPSPSNSLPLPLEENPSQKAKDLSPPSLVTREDGDDQNIILPSLSIAVRTNNNDQVSLNDGVVVIEEQFLKDDEFRVLESKLSHSNNLPLHLVCQTPPVPSEGYPAQIMENSSSPSIVMWELEQLVSEKYLDCEILSLLTKFLVKHPSVLLKDISLGNIYKGYAYICLAELLQFLQTHSVLDVLGSSRSKFVNLLQAARNFAFDKDWLDSVERRALCSDIQVSHDALQKLMETKQQVSKEVEALRLKIEIFNQHVKDLKHQLTSSEAVLESIVQQEADILETKAALSVPLGY
ncbi:hypothetical protein TSUD_154250 [Trifolium subterraneum]|uniref:CC-NBS-LRR resistance protein n=1 Tax=Trifolium subterraneum TaxID=3900 RepID=A0A2Z6NQS4_TRISU|nr:hypothetical protein TSUD_154250 [Trifolium subterraneum]